MSEVADADWVHGRPEWWRSTAGKSPTKTYGVFGSVIDDGVESKSVPLQFHWEILPSNEWKLADMKKGGKGWVRQRFKPPARSILLPCSWSIFFLIVTIVPLVFPGKTPDDQVTSLILFISTWCLLYIPAWMALNEMPRGGGWLVGRKTIIYFSIGITAFSLHILVDAIIGWVSYSFFCIAWFSQILRFQNGFKVPSNRWILPFEHSEWKREILGKNWEISSVKWRNGPLAIHSVINGLELHGTSRSGERFIALHFHGKEGWLNDPFTKQMESEKIHEFLKTPPIKSEGKMWNVRFLQRIEKLNEAE